MFSSNCRISNLQVKKLLIIEIFAQSGFLVSFFSSKYGAGGSLIAMILSSIGALIYCAGMIYVAALFKKGYLTEIRKSLGYKAFVIIGIIYIARFMVRGGFILKYLQGAVERTLLKDTRELYIILPMIIICSYSALRDMEQRARLIEMIFLWTFIPLVLIWIFALKNIELSNFIPVFIENTKIIKGSLFIVALYIPVELIIFLMPYCGKDKKIRNLLGTVGIAILINLINYFVIVGSSGETLTGDTIWSAFRIMQAVKFPGNAVQRLDLFMVTFLITALFSLISGYMFYSTKILKKIFPKGNAIFCVIFLGIVLYLVTINMDNVESSYETYIKYAAYVDLPFSIICPLIIYFFIKRKQVREL